jgi:hypothetical protein
VNNVALSNQLDKLTVRAKQAETRAAAAESKTRRDLETDVAAARASAHAEAARLGEMAEAGRRGGISTWRANAQQTWNDYIAAVHQTIDEANTEVDFAQAQHAADAAENDASYAIDYAYAAIEQAEYAVLHAEFARMKADDLRATARTTA